MGNTPLYRKIFLIFNQEDMGYGNGNEPSGHMKIETNNGKGTLTLLVQNLIDAPGLTYKAYIIKCDVNAVVPVLIGTIPVQKGKGELSWEFKPENVGMTERSIDEFNMAAVIVEYTNKPNNDIICPLVALRDKKLVWREKLKGLIYEKQQKNLYKREDSIKKEDTAKKEDTIKRKELYSKYEGGESIAPLSEKEVQSAITQIQKDFELPADENRSESSGYSTEAIQEQASDLDACKNAAKECIEESSEENMEEVLKNKTSDISDNSPTYDSREDKDVNTYNESSPGDKDVNTYSESSPEDRDINSCIYNPDSLCSRTEVKFENACLNCPVMNMNRQQERAEPLTGDINRLKDQMDETFEVYYPFSSRRRDYKWWKVNNLAYMNSILYQCSIKTPMMFNPKVLMAHFKYRHLILGIYTDRVRRKECLVFGIPAVYSVDEKPFSKLCRWAQQEGQKPQYGAFGYWLMYIDPKTGNTF